MSKRILIIGQGIAGTMLAHTLIGRGHQVMVLDSAEAGSGSLASAGMFNVLGGRAWELSWRALEFLSCARKEYRSIERTLSKTSIYHETPLLRAFSSHEDAFNLGQVLKRGTVPGALVKRWFEPGYHPSGLLALPFGGVLLAGSGYVEVENLLKHSKKWLERLDSFRFERFDETQLVQTSSGIEYGEEVYDAIVYANGAWANKSKYWSHLPLYANKGEVLEVSMPEESKVGPFLSYQYLVPHGGDYRFGATYSWKDLDPEPTQQGEAELTTAFYQKVSNEAEIIGIKAGFRGGVRDRRPLLGRHPESSNVWIFNGFGTKSTLLAPLCAAWMYNAMFYAQEVPKEADVNRFR